MLEQDGEGACRKMADRLQNECAGLFDRLSAKGRVVIPGVLLLCMAGVTVFPPVATVCFMAANARFVHGTILWKITGYITCAIVSGIVLPFFMCRGLPRIKETNYEVSI